MKLNRFIFAICLAAAFTAAPSAVRAFDANVAGIEEAVGEAKITVKVDEFSSVVNSDDAEKAKEIADEIVILVADRNKRCKNLK